MHKQLWIVSALLMAGNVLAAADSSTVVARRGGQEVTLAEIDARVAEVPEQHRAGFMDNPQRIEKLVRDLLLMQQLAAEAEAEGLDKDPTLAAQLDLARVRFLATKRLEQLARAQPAGDLELLAHEQYSANPDRFAEPDSAEVRHLLIKRACRSDDEARKLADGYRQRVVDGKAKLEDLARQFSEDDGTKNGGGLIMVRPGTMVPPFEKASLDLAKPGDIAPLVETEYGYHVIELVRKFPGHKQTYEQVKPALIQQIDQERRGRTVREHTDQLQNLAIEADEPTVASLRSRYVTASAQTSAVGKPAAEAKAEPND